MANEPSWEDIFKAAQTSSEPPALVPPAEQSTTEHAPTEEPATRQYPATPPADDPLAHLFPPAQAAPAPEYTPTRAFPTADPAVPMSRRELREREGHRRAASSEGDAGVPTTGVPATSIPTTGGHGAGAPAGDGHGGGHGSHGRPKKRSLLWLKITLPILLVLGAVGGVAAFGWFNYNEQVRELLGIPLPTDYDGTGNGTEVIVAIRSGDIGSDVANSLHEAGVTMTFDAVYDLLIENPDISFMPGNWRLQEEMSAQSAVDALQDTANKVTSELLLTEGTVLPDALEIIAETTGIPLADVQAAAANPAVYGLPANALTLEGYLFPATYELDGSETAQQILQKLVDTMFQHLDEAGVPVENRHTVLIMASIIQREAGWNPDDFYKVGRVFQNRIDQGINLESDATVAYGTGNLHTVWTTDAERADASNLYNTYANAGLPIGPIGLPGDLAIDAALHPADGPWLFFVPINLQTGETVFSETLEQHEAARDQLFEWCEASDENASYCE
jgi:UPF0755 protein